MNTDKLNELNHTKDEIMIKPTWKDEEYGIELYHADCLDVLPELSYVDAVITDPPYGTTACKWDTVIPLDLMWVQLKRIIKCNGAIVLFGNQPFTTKLISSNYKMFKYCWVWDKVRPSGFHTAKYKPMMRNEDIIIFCHKSPEYNPQLIKREKKIKGRISSSSDSNPIGYIDGKYREYTHKNPQSIIVFSKQSDGKYVHPTQKPVALIEYLINTYTNKNETVLDFTMGSGTTGVAAVNLGRKFIGIEMEREYFDISVERIKQAIIDKQGGELFATHQPDQQQELF